MNTDIVIDKIKKDCKDEFEIMKREVLRFKPPNSNIDNLKQMYSELINNSMSIRTKLLFDTLVNYLMETSLSLIEKQENEIQNDFLKQDFRTRMINWANEPSNILSLNPSNIQFSSDPRRKAGYIASSFVFILWLTSVLAIKPKNHIVLSLVTISTIISTTLAYKFGFKYSEQKTLNQIELDINEFISKCENQVLTWLLKVTDTFNDDFNEFCTLNKI